MAQWTFVDPNTLLPGDPWTSAKAQAAFENLEAVAEGAPDAPRVLGDALNLLVTEIDPAGMASVIVTDLEASDFTLEFYTIQPSGSSDRRLLLDPSYDNGATFKDGSISGPRISTIVNFRDASDGRLGGLSGYFRSENTVPAFLTGRPRTDGFLDSTFSDARLAIHSAKPFVPMNAFRLRWSSGSFGSDANQRIRLYQGGNRPFGGKP